MDEVLDYLAQFDYTKKLPDDQSGDDRYLCMRDGESFQLRVSEGADYERKKKEYEQMKKLSEKVSSMPRCVDFSISDSGKKVFTLLTMVPGKKA